MNVFVLTEGGGKIGFGHITRCLALSQAFEKSGIVPKFIANGDSTIKDILRDRKYLAFNWLEEYKKVSDLLREADIAVIDSYLADLQKYRQISDVAKLSVYLDDNYRLDYPRGIVVNGSINAESLGYQKSAGSEYLLGAKYTPLRKEFWDVPGKTIGDNVASIMVTFGGDDVRNMTPYVLRLLVEKYPGMSKHVVIGKGYFNTDRIIAAADENTVLHYYPDAEDMRDIMLASDIAISAGGQTLFELARIGVPAIAVAVADNQMSSIKGWQRAGFVEYAGWWEDGMLLDNVRSALKQLEVNDRRNKMSKTGRTLVDGKGAKRIVEYLVSLKNREDQ